MYKIIGERNKVNYGVIDEPVDFNYQEFKLLNFFNKEIKGLKKNIAFHAFNYVGIFTESFAVGFAGINLGYLSDCFAFLYDYKKGKIFEMDIKLPKNFLNFPANPDEYNINFKFGKTNMSIKKSHESGILDINAVFKGKLEIHGTFKYSLKSHNPLRVLNPSCGDGNLFTFTEKCSPILPEKLEIKYEGTPLEFDIKKTYALYDWSGGYLNRRTNWYWSAMCGRSNSKTTIGANFAALVNESFFSENAFWINNKRTRVQRCIYDFDPIDPYLTPWHIWSEDKKVDIIFHPENERKDRVNAGPIAKTIFRQFFGTYEGKLTPDTGKPVKFKDIRGLGEIHRAVW